MMAGTAYFTDHFLGAFSWMLIHSLWQGILLAMVCGLALMAARNLSPAMRYNMVLFCFALFIACAGGTFFWYWDSGEAPAAVSAASTNPASGWIRVDSSLVSAISAYFSRNAPVVVLIWFVIFVFRAVKIMRGVLELNVLRYSGNQPAPHHWQERTADLGFRIGLNRSVKLLESSRVKIPVVLGHFSPIILMPLGLLTGIPAGQLEAVLLHELAHIRRNDFVVNLLQSLIETIFFFNPGLLWISELLKQEREHCCDELAVSRTGNRKEFVQALLSFKEYSLTAQQLGVGFPGQKNQLLDRARRVLGYKRSGAPSGAYVFAAISGFLLICLLGTTLTVAQINPSGTQSKPIPAELTSLFKKEVPGERGGSAPDKIRMEISRREEVSPVLKADNSAQNVPAAAVPDSLSSVAELGRLTSQERARLAEAEWQRAELVQQKSMADKALAEKAREQAEAKRLETIRNKAKPIPPINTVIEPVDKR